MAYSIGKTIIILIIYNKDPDFKDTCKYHKPDTEGAKPQEIK